MSTGEKSSQERRFSSSSHNSSTVIMIQSESLSDQESKQYIEQVPAFVTQLRLALQKLNENQSIPNEYGSLDDERDKIIRCQYTLAGALCHYAQTATTSMCELEKEALQLYEKIYDDLVNLNDFELTSLNEVEYGTMLHQMGRLCQSLNHTKEAVQYLQLALTLHRKFFHPFLESGNADSILKEVTNDLQNAITQQRLFTRVLKSLQELLLSFVSLGENWQQLQDRETSLNVRNSIRLCRLVFSNFKEGKNCTKIETFAPLDEAFQLLDPYVREVFYANQCNKENATALFTIFEKGSKLYSILVENDTSKSMAYLKKATDIAVHALGLYHPSARNLLLDLGNAYSKTHQHEEALRTYEKSLSSVKGLQEHGDEISKEQIPHICMKISSIHFLQGNYESAFSTCEKFVDEIINDNNDDTNTTIKQALALTLSNMGTAKLMLGLPNEALGLFERAIKTQISIVGEYHPSVSETYFNMGIANQVNDRLKFALQAFNRAQEIMEKIGCGSEKVACVVHAKANVYCKMDDFNKKTALQLYSLALWMQTNSTREVANEKIAMTLVNMGMTCLQMNQLDVSLSCFEDALEHMRFLSDEPPRKCVAVALNGIGNVCFKKKDFTKAQNYYEESLRVKKSFCRLSKSVSRTLINLASTYAIQNDLDGALRNYNLAIMTWSDGGVYQTFLTARIVSGIGRIKLHQRSYKEALAYYFEAKHILFDLTDGRSIELHKNVHLKTLSLRKKINKKYGKTDSSFQPHDFKVLFRRA